MGARHVLGNEETRLGRQQLLHIDTVDLGSIIALAGLDHTGGAASAQLAEIGHHLAKLLGVILRDFDLVTVGDDHGVGAALLGLGR